MSLKCIRTIFSKFYLILPIVIISIVITEGIAFASNPVDGTVNRYYMDDQDNINVVLFNTKWWIKDNGDWDGHVTNNNYEEFTHNHVQDDWPRGGHTEEEAKRYFDEKWEYHPESSGSSGTADPKYNCHAYAFDRTGYWIESESEILSNDYVDASKNYNTPQKLGA